MPTRTTFVIVWLCLLGASAVLFAMVAAAAWWQRRRERPGRARRRAERAEWEQHAAAVVARSRQAAARANAARDRLAAAERTRVEAWDALDAAQAAHETARQRHGQTTRRSAEQPADPAGQRAVTEAALAAYRRGDLSQEQLWRVWQWGSGRDPELDGSERELLRARAAQREAHQRYRTASSRERAAAAEVEIAEVQERALAEEAATAAVEAGWDDSNEAEAGAPRRRHDAEVAKGAGGAGARPRRVGG